jgi:hypothetical protein
VAYPLILKDGSQKCVSGSLAITGFASCVGAMCSVRGGNRVDVLG